MASLYMDSSRMYHGDPRAMPSELSYGSKLRKLHNHQYYLSPTNRGRLLALAHERGFDFKDAVEFIDRKGDWL